VSPAHRSSVPVGRFDFTAPVPPARELGAVHFVAIGGSGVSGVARLFLAEGVAVSGSDQRDSDTLRQLAAEGARVHVGHDAAHLGRADTVVISGAVRESNPELAAARERGLRVLHRAQGIAALLHGRTTAAVAGANGKTTTSAMLTVALQAAGADPAYVLGSGLVGPGTNAAPGTGPVVVEADESDGSFLAYRPQVAVVTNITADHLDFYGDLEAVHAAFEEFADTLGADGVLVASADDPGSRRLAERCRGLGRSVLTWGTDPAAGAGSDGERGQTSDQEPDHVPDLVLSDVGGTGRTWGADLTWTRTVGDVPAGTRRRLTVPMPGAHNLHNAAAALLAATGGLGQPLDAVLEGLAAFPGTHRRFEAVGEAAGVEVVDDYAHNPDKVAAVVRAGRSVVSEGAADGQGTGDESAGAPSRRLVVAFQPHLYSRTQTFAAQFAAGLAAADVVVMLDVYGAREEPLPGVDGALVADLVAGQPDPPEVHYLPDLASAPGELAALLRPGDLLLTVGAGDVTTLGPQVLDVLRSRHTEEETR
jgi:UDP-N-acetylmuramate--alanine ligase